MFWGISEQRCPARGKSNQTLSLWRYQNGCWTCQHHDPNCEGKCRRIQLLLQVSMSRPPQVWFPRWTDSDNPRRSNCLLNFVCNQVCPQASCRSTLLHCGKRSPLLSSEWGIQFQVEIGSSKLGQWTWLWCELGLETRTNNGAQVKLCWCLLLMLHNLRASPHHFDLDKVQLNLTLPHPKLPAFKT